MEQQQGCDRTGGGCVMCCHSCNTVLPSGLARTSILFHGPEMEEFAQKLLKCDSGKLLRLGRISWNRFEDGFPNLFIHDVEAVRGSDVIFLMSLLNHNTFLAQLSVLFALPRYMAKSLMVILPYYPTGTMERVDLEGQIATAYTLARILSLTPVTERGATRMLVYDIHALPNRFYFRDSVLPILVSALPLLVDVLKTNHKHESIAIAFPDEGAAKRFWKYFEGTGWETIVCQKVRDGDRRVITIKEGDPRGKHIFIVDDLIKTGGTLLECKVLLLEKGATATSAFVTHPVFPAESWKKFTEAKGVPPFKKVYITDSCPESAKLLAGKEPFEVISLVPNIYQHIERYLKKTPKRVAAL